MIPDCLIKFSKLFFSASAQFLILSPKQLHLNFRLIRGSAVCRADVATAGSPHPVVSDTSLFSQARIYVPFQVNSDDVPFPRPRRSLYLQPSSAIIISYG